jgi:hypothetical protein
MKMRFGDMPYGTWFKTFARKPRIFIKMQNILPSGRNVVYKSFEVVDIPEGQDSRHALTGACCTFLHLNAIDTDGVPGSCPDWLEFDTIDNPFKIEN